MSCSVLPLRSVHAQHCREPLPQRSDSGGLLQEFGFGGTSRTSWVRGCNPMTTTILTATSATTYIPFSLSEAQAQHLQDCVHLGFKPFWCLSVRVWGFRLRVCFGLLDLDIRLAVSQQDGIPEFRYYCRIAASIDKMGLLVRMGFLQGVYMGSKRSAIRVL